MYQEVDDVKPEGEGEESFSAAIFEDAIEDFGEEVHDPLEEDVLLPHEEEEEPGYEFFMDDEDHRDAMY